MVVMNYITDSRFRAPFRPGTKTVGSFSDRKRDEGNARKKSGVIRGQWKHHDTTGLTRPILCPRLLLETRLETVPNAGIWEIVILTGGDILLQSGGLVYQGFQTPNLSALLSVLKLNGIVCQFFLICFSFSFLS